MNSGWEWEGHIQSIAYGLAFQAETLGFQIGEAGYWFKKNIKISLFYGQNMYLIILKHLHREGRGTDTTIYINPHLFGAKLWVSGREQFSVH